MKVLWKYFVFINVQGKWRYVNFIHLYVFDGRILGIAYIGF